MGRRSIWTAGSKAMGMVLVLALASGACSGSGDKDVLTYKDPDRYSLFKIPTDWNLYDKDDLSGLAGLPFVVRASNFPLPVISQVAFEGSPTRDPANLVQPLSTADFPIGAAVVRTIGSEQRDYISRYHLAELVVPYHSQLEAGEAGELLKEDFAFDDFAGVRLVLWYTDAQTEETAGVYLISVTDPEVTRMYSIAVGCSERCWELYRDDIASVVDSWLVNTR
ncbi:MAG: hypothetical protein ACE5KX_07570 [Acidimicrobiia bacterium]